MPREGLDLMSGLLAMDPKDRLTAKQALMHPYFDGLRTSAEEEQIAKERERVLKRVESSQNNRNGTISRNGE
jgi:serine/threonine protein kinase